MKYKHTILFLLATGTIHYANAQEDYDEYMDEDILGIYSDEDIVSIATGTKKPIHKAPAVATVITAEDIERSGATDITQVLERVPGLHVYPSDLVAMNPSYSIRGMQTGRNSQVLMLVNGVDMKRLFSGARPEFFRLPVNNIQRIEVLRGPGSAIYGADAFGGVINIVTKSGHDLDGMHAGIKAGDFDDHYAWMQYGKEINDFEFSFSYEEARSGGDQGREIQSDLQTNLDAAFGTEAALAPGALPTGYDQQHVFAELKHKYAYIRASHFKVESEVNSGAAQALDYQGIYLAEDNLLDIGLSTADMWDTARIDFKFSYEDQKNEPKFTLLPRNAVIVIGEDGNLFTPGANGPDGGPVIAMFPDGLIGHPFTDDEKISAELVGLYQGLEHHELRLSVGHKQQEESVSEKKNFGPGVLDENTIGTINELPYIVNGTLTDVTNTPFVYSDNAERDISYVSIQDVWDFHNDWSLTAGVRYDDYSDFGSTTNPRLALVWSTSHNLTTKLLYGEAFRAPSFSELYSKNNPVIIGNLELEPEEIKTSELVFDYRPTEHLSLNLTFFHYQADQLIEFVPQPDGTSKAQNVRGQDGQGFETEIDWQPNDKVHLITNFAFQDTEDAKTGDRIADAPRKQLYSRFDLDLRENLTYFSQLNWVIDRERAKGDPRDDLENYATLDVGLRAQRVFDNMNIGLTVRNLTDEDIVEPSSGTIDDYPMEGRHFVGEVSFKF